MPATHRDGCGSLSQTHLGTPEVVRTVTYKRTNRPFCRRLEGPPTTGRQIEGRRSRHGILHGKRRLSLP
jgi:hypothetical protein